MYICGTGWGGWHAYHSRMLAYVHAASVAGAISLILVHLNGSHRHHHVLDMRFVCHTWLQLHDMAWLWRWAPCEA